MSLSAAGLRMARVATVSTTGINLFNHPANLKLDSIVKHPPSRPFPVANYKPVTEQFRLDQIDFYDKSHLSAPLKLTPENTGVLGNLALGGKDVAVIDVDGEKGRIAMAPAGDVRGNADLKIRFRMEP